MNTTWYDSATLNQMKKTNQDLAGGKWIALLFAGKSILVYLLVYILMLIFIILSIFSFLLFKQI